MVHSGWKGLDQQVAQCFYETGGLRAVDSPTSVWEVRLGVVNTLCY